MSRDLQYTVRLKQLAFMIFYFLFGNVFLASSNRHSVPALFLSTPDRQPHKIVYSSLSQYPDSRRATAIQKKKTEHDATNQA
jgi:hypothetical protein